jgi:hypothetical protein
LAATGHVATPKLMRNRDACVMCKPLGHANLKRITHFRGMPQRLSVEPDAIDLPRCALDQRMALGADGGCVFDLGLKQFGELDGCARHDHLFEAHTY